MPSLRKIIERFILEFSFTRSFVLKDVNVLSGSEYISCDFAIYIEEEDSLVTFICVKHKNKWHTTFDIWSDYASKKINSWPTGCLKLLCEKLTEALPTITYSLHVIKAWEEPENSEEEIKKELTRSIEKIRVGKARFRVSKPVNELDKKNKQEE